MGVKLSPSLDIGQRCHYMTRVGGCEGPHATCAFLILILHGLPSCYTSTYTCRRQRTGHTTVRIFHHGGALCITLGDPSSFQTQALPFGYTIGTFVNSLKKKAFIK
jgi:hypothetical protein